MRKEDSVVQMEPEEMGQSLEELMDETSEASIPISTLPWWLLKASGTYVRSKFPKLAPAPLHESTNGVDKSDLPTEIGILPFYSDEIRLDIDGRYPQSTVSGVLRLGFAKCHWIARIKYYGNNVWRGYIWYKRGAVHLLPQPFVKLVVQKSFFTFQRYVYLTFYGRGLPSQTAQYRWKSAYFRKVNFEHDYATDATLHISYNTGTHPNRPPGLPIENLTVKKVYQRAGFDVSESGTSAVPKALAGANGKWSDMEMHDAMQTYWSRFTNSAQWAMWVFFASLHEQGSSLGGVMFDTIGPNERQGTAIFCDSFINNAPPGDPNPSAWQERMKFWTTVHEMGHAFNLAHSWQKELVWNGYGPWIPLQDDPEARSFMNYPFSVQGGQQKFFEDFEFRFIDEEYLFLRHAPYEFVQPGNYAFFDHHGFEDTDLDLGVDFQLELRVHRDKNEFQFMEPVRIEAKLKNTSAKPQVITDHVLDHFDHLTFVIKKRGMTGRRWAPFTRKMLEPTMQVLAPGEAIYRSIPVGIGMNGWDLSEPGHYIVKAAMEIEDQMYLSNDLMIRIAPPVSYEQEYLAQDYFTEEVARILYFEGSRYLQRANDTLKEVTSKFSTQNVARYARLALTKPHMKSYKKLVIPPEAGGMAISAAEAGGWVDETKPNPDLVRKEMAKVLLKEQQEAATTFGHLTYEKQMVEYGEFLSEQGDMKEATEVLSTLHKTMSKDKVVDSAIDRIERIMNVYEKKTTTTKTTRRTRRSKKETVK